MRFVAARIRYLIVSNFISLQDTEDSTVNHLDTRCVYLLTIWNFLEVISVRRCVCSSAEFSEVFTLGCFTEQVFENQFRR